MGFFDSFADLFDSPAPACERCREADGADVTMDYPEAEYAPRSWARWWSRTSARSVNTG